MASTNRIKRSGNFAIYGVLWSLAGVSATLPIYIHLHPEHFGPPLMTFYGATQSQMNSSQDEHSRMSAALLKTKLQLDQVITGSIEPPLNQTKARITKIPAQQFPVEENSPSPPVQFISATKDRALAIVDGRLRIFVPGDLLPDGRTIRGFEQALGAIKPVVSKSEQSGENERFPLR